MVDLISCHGKMYKSCFGVIFAHSEMGQTKCWMNLGRGGRRGKGFAESMLRKESFLSVFFYLSELVTTKETVLIFTSNLTFALSSTQLIRRYMDIPVVSRLYFTGAFLTTAGCALDIISPFSLYFNFDLIFFQGQIWRLITTYLFFGMFSIDFLFHMYFLVS